MWLAMSGRLASGCGPGKELTPMGRGGCVPKPPVPKPGIMQLFQLGSHYFKLLDVFPDYSPTCNGISKVSG